MSKMVKIIAGLMGGSVSSGSGSVSSPESLRSFLSILQKHRVSELDTARVYNGGKSEEALGQLPSAQKNFTIATKAPGFMPGSLAYENVIANCDASLKALKQDSIDLYYFHGPDRQTPLQESLRAMDDLHKDGKIKYFGISNYRADEVEQINDICSEEGYIKPTVYQGGFNGLFRGSETRLFPVLRKFGIAFYAYSPLGGGYFSKTSAQLRQPAEGSRMEQMKVFQQIYVNETSLALHDKLQAACEKEGVGMKEAALRWIMHHSILGEEDGVILGASNGEQMEENLCACEGGPLSQELVNAFEETWKVWSDDGKNEGRMVYSV